MIHSVNLHRRLVTCAAVWVLLMAHSLHGQTYSRNAYATQSLGNTSATPQPIQSHPSHSPLPHSQSTHSQSGRAQVQPRLAPQRSAAPNVRPVNYSEFSSPVPDSSVPGEPRKLAISGQGVRAESVQTGRARFVRTVSSLGVVAGLMMGFVWWTRKNQGDSPYVPASHLVEVVGRVALDAKHKAHIVRFGDRLLLLSLEGNGVSKLGEIAANEQERRFTPEKMNTQRTAISS